MMLCNIPNCSSQISNIERVCDFCQVNVVDQVEGEDHADLKNLDGDFLFCQYRREDFPNGHCPEYTQTIQAMSCQSDYCCSDHCDAQLASEEADANENLENSDNGEEEAEQDDGEEVEDVEMKDEDDIEVKAEEKA